jgi:pimeloyl-ACP methyl ester carboxylesterase
MATSNAVNLAFEERGKGIPILCLHGHPGSAKCMRVFTEPLSQQYRAIAPDLRGYSRSWTHKPFTMTDHLTDLEQLLETLNIDRCFILGWSLGGIMAQELALRHPQKVAGLVLIATAARPESKLPLPTAKELGLTVVAGLINALLPGWGWNIRTFGQHSILKYLLRRHTPEVYRHLAESATGAVLKTSPAAHRVSHTSNALALCYQENAIATLFRKPANPPTRHYPTVSGSAIPTRLISFPGRSPSALIQTFKAG